MSRRMLALAGGCALAAGVAVAEDKKDEPPRIVAVTPLRIVAGETQTVRLRGLKLKDVTEIRSTPPITATVKEKKDAALPTGLEAKEIGDQELVVELLVPADCPAKAIALEAIAPTGTTAPREVPIMAKDAEVREKEPNNGFHEAQPWDGLLPMAGRIEGDKDVDVFQVAGHAGQALVFHVTASAVGSLLDPVLAIFDGAGEPLVSADDSEGSRDPRLSFTPKTDGPLYLVVSDAHDRGGPWHEYRLEKEATP